MITLKCAFFGQDCVFCSTLSVLWVMSKTHFKSRSSRVYELVLSYLRLILVSESIIFLLGLVSVPDKEDFFSQTGQDQNCGNITVLNNCFIHSVLLIMLWMHLISFLFSTFIYLNLFSASIFMAIWIFQMSTVCMFHILL